VEIEPNNVQVYIARRKCYDALNQTEKVLGDHNKIVEIYTEEREKNPNNPWSYWNLSEYYSSINEKEELAKNSAKMAEALPGYSWAHAGCANDHRAIKQYEKAIVSYAKAVELEPRNLIFWFDFALCYEEAKEYVNAVRIYTKILEITPDNVYAYRARADHYNHNLKQYEKALEDYIKAIEIEPSFSFTYKARGGVYEKLNMTDKAEEDYDAATFCEIDEVTHETALKAYCKEIFDNRWNKTSW